MEFKYLVNKNIELKHFFLNLDESFLKKQISGITNNSLRVKKNFLFVAIKGNTYDGNDYVENAQDNGASLIISSKIEGQNILKIPENNISIIYPLLCSAFYENNWCYWN